ncbi:MAG TPA: class I tRNA ligase family protein, partial [Flavobacteriaceae bacterium]|nr:class I tRNA ligase family protein [Flavobacteriaceae bacterium]
IGGSEHATGHLLYARFWQKFMFDKGLVPVDEFAKKLINQGMILGTSAKVKMSSTFSVKDKLNRFSETKLNLNIPILFSDYNFKDYPDNGNYFRELFNTIIEFSNAEDKEFLLKSYDENIVVENLEFSRSYNIPVDCVDSRAKINIEKLQNWEMFESIFGKVKLIKKFDLFADYEVEKMSKSKYNVVNPDQICKDYGADSLRLYEMFLGPLEQYKPWNTAGISGVHSFLKKLWKLYFDDNGLKVTDTSPAKDSLKTLHKTIKKVEEDIENFSFNTSVSTFMIAVNELTAQKCTSKDILEPLLILISPYAPHIAEELWEKLGHTESISIAPFPKFDEKYLVESSKNYPISFNGKTRFTLELPLDMSKEDIEKTVLENEKTQEQLQGRTPKKIIVVPGKIINIVG